MKALITVCDLPIIHELGKPLTLVQVRGALEMMFVEAIRQVPRERRAAAADLLAGLGALDVRLDRPEQAADILMSTAEMHEALATIREHLPVTPQEGDEMVLETGEIDPEEMIMPLADLVSLVKSLI